eukprot:1359165-Rhodomonas_salina.1
MPPCLTDPQVTPRRIVALESLATTHVLWVLSEGGCAFQESIVRNYPTWVWISRLLYVCAVLMKPLPILLAPIVAPGIYLIGSCFIQQVHTSCFRDQVGICCLRFGHHQASTAASARDDHRLMTLACVQVPEAICAVVFYTLAASYWRFVDLRRELQHQGLCPLPACQSPQ